MFEWIKKFFADVEEKNIIINCYTLDIETTYETPCIGKEQTIYWSEEYQEYLNHIDKKYNLNVVRGIRALNIHDPSDWEGNEKDSYLIYAVPQKDKEYDKYSINDFSVDDSPLFRTIMHSYINRTDTCIGMRDNRTFISIPVLSVVLTGLIHENIYVNLIKGIKKISAFIPVFVINKHNLNYLPDFDLYTKREKINLEFYHFKILSPYIDPTETYYSYPVDQKYFLEISDLCTKLEKKGPIIRTLTFISYNEMIDRGLLDLGFLLIVTGSSYAAEFHNELLTYNIVMPLFFNNKEIEDYIARKIRELPDDRLKEIKKVADCNRISYADSTSGDASYANINIKKTLIDIQQSNLAVLREIANHINSDPDKSISDIFNKKDIYINPDPDKSISNNFKKKDTYIDPFSKVRLADTLPNYSSLESLASDTARVFLDKEQHLTIYPGALIYCKDENKVYRILDDYSIQEIG